MFYVGGTTLFLLATVWVSLVGLGCSPNPGSPDFIKGRDHFCMNAKVSVLHERGINFKQKVASCVDGITFYGI